jgi:hypothetical protein
MDTQIWSEIVKQGVLAFMCFYLLIRHDKLLCEIRDELRKMNGRK